MNSRRRAMAASVAQRKKRKLLCTSSRTLRIYRSGTGGASCFLSGKPCSNKLNSRLTLCMAQLRMEVIPFHGATSFFRSSAGPLEAVAAFFRYSRRQHYRPHPVFCLHSTAQRTSSRTPFARDEASISFTERDGEGKS